MQEIKRLETPEDWAVAVKAGDHFTITSSKGQLGPKFSSRLEALRYAARQVFNMPAGSEDSFIEYRGE